METLRWTPPFPPGHSVNNISFHNTIWLSQPTWKKRLCSMEQMSQRYQIENGDNVTIWGSFRFCLSRDPALKNRSKWVQSLPKSEYRNRVRVGIISGSASRSGWKALSVMKGRLNRDMYKKWMFGICMNHEHASGVNPQYPRPLPYRWKMTSMILSSTLIHKQSQCFWYNLFFFSSSSSFHSIGS